MAWTSEANQLLNDLEAGDRIMGEDIGDAKEKDCFTEEASHYLPHLPPFSKT